MIDSLVRMKPKALERNTAAKFGQAPGCYALLTLHRPANVDDPATLKRLLELFGELSKELPIIFPVHPRTKKMMEALAYTPPVDFKLVEPEDYLDSLCLQAQAKLVLTDSGGIQEETSCLGIPCLTLRPNTERPITVELGTSTIVGNDEGKIRQNFEAILRGGYKTGGLIPLWDGFTAGRVAEALAKYL